MEAKDLLVGQFFESKSCAELMRNLVCLRQSYTGTYVYGEWRNDIKGDWKKDSHYIGGTAEVIPLDKPLATIEKSFGGVLRVVGDYKEDINVEKRKRGRKGVEIAFPKEAFTIPKLAEKLGCSTTHIFVKVKAMLKKGEIRIVGKKRKKNQRGRATCFYQLLDYIHKS